MDNCFTFTYQYLKKQGFNVPDNLGTLKYDEIVKDIITNHKYYLKNKLHIKFFEGWTKVVNEAVKNDIILHNFGVGVAIDKHRLVSFDHRNKVIIKPIRKNCEIRRIIK